MVRWIEDKNEYQKMRDLARWCADVDSGRLPTDYTKLYFCDVTSINHVFPTLLQDLLMMARDQSCIYMVLDPDPEYFWHDRLGGYPTFEFSRGDSADEYLKFLNRPFGSNRGDNMADMWYSYVIFPPTRKWCVHTIRSERNDTGHLWIPPEWASGIMKIYPFVKDELSPPEAREVRRG